jgi:hypothetical protein
MADAFYLPLGDERYGSTPATEGPWDPRFQHGGPPTALLVHELARCAPRPDALLARLTAEFLAPVPVGDLEVASRVLKDGRTVQLLEAELAAEGRTVMRARAWRLRRADLDDLHGMADDPPPALPEQSVPSPVGLDFGYARAIEWRVVRGDTAGPGPATVWTRLRTAVVDGREPSPVERVVAAADSGSGISAVLDWSRWTFVNVDLTVHLLRPPRGTWICMDSRTHVDRGGTAVASTALYDLHGRIGTGAQALLVAPR